MTGNEELARALLELDALLGHPTRFAIVTVLYALGPMTVGDLARALRVSYGPLSTHLRKLEEEGYVELRKVLTLRGPRTAVYLTERGARAYLDHVERLRAIIAAVAESSRAEGGEASKS